MICFLPTFAVNFIGDKKMERIKNIVFDFGGVIVNFSREAAVKKFEIILSELAGKELTYEQVKEGWLGFMLDVPQYRLEYLLELRKKYKLYILSNTNPY
ncbi:MAG: haloacid dehalogenase, partial [Bacteroidetes bacterium]|nr:haloacid dehalogenase [Bacteroidota bacterium]